ncbi:hypothetical protein [Vibrio sp. CAU 1672]|uniref:hypothetical protein n=1 Tax=Vibrio sp. CAU 1672 TaxID=3032594 RepID=UPI0023D9BBC5|nr:hypothetical protein [Vibrio sp. CAU 1672]MDF2154618.1 hypothetical protein [Vibrio sp. CAU 1672]
MKPITLFSVSLASSLFVAPTLQTAEDIDNGHEDYTINRTIEDLTAKEVHSWRSAARIGLTSSSR